MWAKQLSSITLRRPENLCPIPGKMGPFFHGRASKSERSDIKSKFSHLIAVWPCEGYLMSLLQKRGRSIYGWSSEDHGNGSHAELGGLWLL